MSLKMKPTKSQDFSGELPPEGDHFATCVAVVDLGTHTPTRGYGGEPPKARHEVYIAWELVDLPGRPIVAKNFTASLHERATLRLWIKEWRNNRDIGEGEEFDIKTLAGKKCQLTVVHSKSGDRTFAIVEKLSKLRPSDKVRDALVQPVTYDLDDEDSFVCPDWMPWLYGRPIDEWVSTCEELVDKVLEKGQDAKHTSRNASADDDDKPDPWEAERKQEKERDGSGQASDNW